MRTAGGWPETDVSVAIACTVDHSPDRKMASGDASNFMSATTRKIAHKSRNDCPSEFTAKSADTN